MSGLALNVKQWLSFLGGRAQEQQIHLSEEVMNLFRLRREHRLLRVRLEGTSTPYQTLLLEVDLKANQLLLDEPFPGTLPLESWVGRRIVVDSVEQGIVTHFTAKVEAVQQFAQSPALALAMPQDLSSAQRRRHYRLPIEAHMNIQAMLKMHDEEPLPVGLVDISVQGVRMRIPGRWASLPRGSLVCLSLGVDSHVMAELDPKSLSIEGEGERSVTLVGAQMVSLEPAHQRRLSQFILRQQRRQRQQELALTE